MSQFFFQDFWDASWKWSQETFGNILQMGPLGPMDHLKKEIKEIDQAYLYKSKEELNKECVDAFFLIQDIAKRNDCTSEHFIELCWEKLEINKKRKWPPISEILSNPNKAATHIKEEGNNDE